MHSTIEVLTDCMFSPYVTLWQADCFIQADCHGQINLVKKYYFFKNVLKGHRIKGWICVICRKRKLRIIILLAGKVAASLSAVTVGSTVGSLVDAVAAGNWVNGNPSFSLSVDALTSKPTKSKSLALSSYINNTCPTSRTWFWFWQDDLTCWVPLFTCLMPHLSSWGFPPRN